MEIKCTKYAAREYDLFILDDSVYSEERVLIPLINKLISPQEISINLELSDMDKIYIKLAKCENCDAIINFCKEYGTLINPYCYVTSNPNHDFVFLKSLFERSINAYAKEKTDLNPKQYLISVEHFQFYQCEMKMLLDINYFLSAKKNSDDAAKFVYNCRKFLRDSSFDYIIGYEYGNVLEDSIEDIFSLTPLSLARFRIATEAFYLKEPNRGKEALRELLLNRDVEELVADCFLKIIYFNDNKDFDYTLEWDTIQSTAKQICADMLRFHLHDLYLNPMLPTENLESFVSDKPSNFPSLISAIFYYFFIDITSSITFRKCANPNCNKMFCCPKNSRKKYCSQNCCNNYQNINYRKRKK